MARRMSTLNEGWSRVPVMLRGRRVPAPFFSKSGSTTYGHYSQEAGSAEFAPFKLCSSSFEGHARPAVTAEPRSGLTRGGTADPQKPRACATLLLRRFDQLGRDGGAVGSLRSASVARGWRSHCLVCLRPTGRDIQPCVEGGMLGAAQECVQRLLCSCRTSLSLDATMFWIWLYGRAGADPVWGGLRCRTATLRMERPDWGG